MSKSEKMWLKVEFNFFFFCQDNSFLIKRSFFACAYPEIRCSLLNPAPQWWQCHATQRQVWSHTVPESHWEDERTNHMMSVHWCLDFAACDTCEKTNGITFSTQPGASHSLNHMPMCCCRGLSPRAAPHYSFGCTDTTKGSVLMH